MISVLNWRTERPYLERLDADLLLCQALDCSRAHLLSHPEQCLSAEQLQQLNACAERRKRGEPLAYLLGYKEFWGLELEVSPAVLVPRPETEILVERALEQMNQLPPLPRILDLGTGSGAIAIALARNLHRLIVASDISTEALAVAMRNSVRHEAQVEFVLGDWFDALSSSIPRFHLIVANPPYIADEDPHLSALQSEPATALVSGPDGFDDLLHIINAAPDYLTEAGWLMLEHGQGQGPAVRQAMTRRGFTPVDTTADLAGIERVTAGHWPEKTI